MPNVQNQIESVIFNARSLTGEWVGRLARDVQRKVDAACKSAYADGVSAGYKRQRENQRIRLAAANTANSATAIDVEAVAFNSWFDPSGYFVYVLWSSGRRVYVGQTTQLLTRLGQHWSDQKKRAAIHRVSLIRCGDVKSMNELERRLIREHSPDWNIHFKAALA